MLKYFELSFPESLGPRRGRSSSAQAWIRDLWTALRKRRSSLPLMMMSKAWWEMILLAIWIGMPSPCCTASATTGEMFIHPKLSVSYVINTLNAKHIDNTKMFCYICSYAASIYISLLRKCFALLVLDGLISRSQWWCIKMERTDSIVNTPGRMHL